MLNSFLSWCRKRLALNGSGQSTLLLALLLLAAVTALYGKFLWNPLVFDDLPVFMVDQEGKQPIVSSYHFSLIELRSLPYATLAWTKAWFGLDLIGFRLGNLLLHAAVTIALFCFLRLLFRQVLADSGEPGKEAPLSLNWMAFFAALVFALHPVAVYGAGYLIQRTIVMSTLFCLLTMLCYLHGSVRQKPLWLWLSVPCYYLAVFSKEHAIMLPAVLLALTVLLHDDWRGKLKQRWGIFVALAAIAAFAVSLKWMPGSVYELNAPEMLRENSGNEAIGQIPYLLSVITQSWLFFKYAMLWVFPNPAWMSIDMREPFAQSPFSAYLLASCAFLAWGAGGFWLLLKRGRAGLAGFALLFPWVMFFTEFSAVRIQEVFVLYRSYLWAAGACAILPLIIWKMTARGAALLLGVIALFMLPLSMERLVTFSHPVLLWDDAEKLVHGRSDLPGEYRIYYNRGIELIKIDRYNAAIGDLTRSIDLYGDQPDAYTGLGLAYMKKNDFENAFKTFDAAIKIGAEKRAAPVAKHYFGRAMAYEGLKNWRAASEDYMVSCKLAGKGCDKTDPARLAAASAN